MIDFDGIDFFYPSRPAVQVLYNFNGVFPPGKTTALVGGSGSGKSTCVGLIERFYDPVAGTVKLDGVPIKDLNLKWLRNQIGLVSQEPVLFATTIAGNVEHGLIGSRFEHESPEQKRQRVIDACKLANADGFISQLPQGYETQIGERGMLLSGGQKRELSLRLPARRRVLSDERLGPQNVSPSLAPSSRTRRSSSSTSESSFTQPSFLSLEGTVADDLFHAERLRRSTRSPRVSSRTRSTAPRSAGRPSRSLTVSRRSRMPTKSSFSRLATS